MLFHKKRSMLLLLLILGMWVLIAMPSITRVPGDAWASAPQYEVVDITTLTDGGRVDWSPDGKWVYHDYREADGFWDVYRIRPDGTGRECLTCDHPQLPNRNQGQPEAHPGNRYLVFQAEKARHWRPFAGTSPGGGHYNDLWLLDLETNEASQLTDVDTDRISGSLHPRFNHDGTKLLWTDLEGWGGLYGDWRLVVADFVTSPTPHLENHQFYNPGPQPVWLESHGWGPDDSWVYFSCTPLLGMDDNNMDICRMDFSSPTEVTRLTFSSGLNGEPGEWDEHAHLSPLNDAFSWISSNGFGTRPNRWFRTWLNTELWLMNVDGSGARQATYFNEFQDLIKSHNLLVRDNDWNPAASGNQQLAVSVLNGFTKEEQIKIIELSISR